MAEYALAVSKSSFPFNSRVQTALAWEANWRTDFGCRHCLFKELDGVAEGVDFDGDEAACPSLPSP